MTRKEWKSLTPGGLVVYKDCGIGLVIVREENHPVLLLPVDHMVFREDPDSSKIFHDVPYDLKGWKVIT